jgi:hypothetical protein
MAVGSTQAQVPIATASPIGFFTNVAARILPAELDVNAQWIQIYPTNQYTPAVHRLLQVTANLYDATTTNYFPHVFRPLFSRDQNGFGTNLFISGYAEVASISGPGDLQFSTPINAWDLANPNIYTSPVLNWSGNVYDVPWIVGAKKGFPNFNEFFMESAYQLERTMLVTRTSTNAFYNNNPNAFSFYPMYNMILTNSFGVECWNSYRSNFTDSLTVYITDALTMTLTNNLGGFSASTGMTNTVTVPLNQTAANYWAGYNPAGNPLMAQYSFITNFPDQFGFGAFPTNFGAIPPSTYRFNTPPDAELPGHVGPYLSTVLNLPYETNITQAGFGRYPTPHWGLVMTNNVRLVMLDPSPDSTGGPYHVIDYVQLGGPYSTRDLTAEIQAGYDTGVNPYYDDQWDTNVTGGVGLPYGMRNQFIVSQGDAGYIASEWGNQSQPEVYNQLNAFRIFLNGPGVPPLTYPGYQPNPAQFGIAAMTNQMQMPFTPSALVVQDIDWQANDPLVHYTPSDLLYTNGTGYFLQLHFPGNLGQLNQRYMPWGGNPVFLGSDVNQYNLQVKDPLVTCSDDWSFPTNQPLNASWLGQVHRGTPWQTIYLKSSDVISGNGLIGTNLWVNWTGDTNATDAVAMAPVRDWHLAGFLAGLFDTNALASQFSVNNPNPAAWEVLLDGLTALTNSSPDSQVEWGGATEIDPITISSNSPQAAVIADAVLALRSGRGQFFPYAGSILAAPQLSVQSPFLNWNDTIQQQWGISDVAYEAIPAQLLPLVRTDSVGSAAAANGQVVIQFSGYDGHTYAVQVSSDLVNWSTVGTNSPFGGAFSFAISLPPNANQQFYRSVLLN